MSVITKYIFRIGFILGAVTAVAVAQDLVTAIEGSVKEIDAASRTVVVATADGAEHTFHVGKDISVHGAKDVAKGGAASFHGVEVGSKVVAHYSVDGGSETLHELDKVGDGGLKVAKGSAIGIGHSTRTVSIKTADGTVKTFDVTGHVAKELGKDTAKGTEVSVYYTEDAAKKRPTSSRRVFSEPITE